MNDYIPQSRMAVIVYACQNMGPLMCNDLLSIRIVVADGITPNRHKAIIGTRLTRVWIVPIELLGTNGLVSKLEKYISKWYRGT